MSGKPVQDKEETAPFTGISEELKAAAEQEMRRTLPVERPAKRSKVDGNGDAATAEDEEEEEEEAAPRMVSRFDYSATQELTEGSGIQGFFVTCRFRREQSALRETASLAIPILEASKPTPTSTHKLSVLKSAGRGLTVIRLSMTDSDNSNSVLPVDIITQTQLAALNVAKTLTDEVTSGTRPRLEHIIRILPVHTTCAVELAALQAAGSCLADVAASLVKGVDNPTFAVTHKSRDTGTTTAVKADQTKAEGDQDTEADGAVVENATTASPSFDRLDAIKAVAAGLESSIREKHNITLKVNLKKPTIVVFIEIVCICDKSYALLSVVPVDVCVVKPKCAMKHIGKNPNKNE